ncbi:MAG TPA: fumarylacetoacetate hydrolase family protein [Steroidobacteraceae bacterium]|nr:fumarylacetoacetate hydrolase family protein [Steroidobacteraceae bacterium]
MSFGLVTYATDEGERIGVLSGEQIFDAAAALYDRLGERPTMLRVLEDWEATRPLLVRLAANAEAGRAAEGIALAQTRLLPPLPRPRDIYCAFANYSDHMKEMGGQPADKTAEDPFLFMVPVTTVIGPEATIQLPAGFDRVDWEAELAAVIGRPARNVSPEQALDYVAGYTMLNDVSARGGARRGANGGRPDFLSSKGRESFKPMGPALVPAQFIPEPQALSVRLWVSGELKQDSNTAQMIFTTAELISFASHVGTLQPGDVFATGTPAGVGMPRGTFLKSGDEVTIEIEGLGRLHNPVGRSG